MLDDYQLNWNYYGKFIFVNGTKKMGEILIGEIKWLFAIDPLLQIFLLLKYVK